MKIFVKIIYLSFSIFFLSFSTLIKSNATSISTNLNIQEIKGPYLYVFVKDTPTTFAPKINHNSSLTIISSSSYNLSLSQNNFKSIPNSSLKNYTISAKLDNQLPIYINSIPKKVIHNNKLYKRNYNLNLILNTNNNNNKYYGNVYIDVDTI